MKNKIKKFLSFLRFSIYKKKFIKYGNNITINKKCKFSTKKISLGNNVNFNGINIKGKGNVQIGNNFHSGTECLIITSFHNYEGEKIPYDETTLDKNVVIEDNVWIGDRVIILGGVTIKEGAIVQAGSVVTKNVEKCSIVGGAPAKEFKKRDIKHYEKLKKEGKFN